MKNRVICIWGKNILNTSKVMNHNHSNDWIIKSITIWMIILIEIIKFIEQIELILKNCWKRSTRNRIWMKRWLISWTIYRMNSTTYHKPVLLYHIMWPIYNFNLSILLLNICFYERIRWTVTDISLLDYVNNNTKTNYTIHRYTDFRAWCEKNLHKKRLLITI